ncbi:MAG: zinc ribbon domain-containing protein [Coprococcus sp.]|uniref:zinc ribbon domain-containing protein n=1 Tax=Coprococcus catus TaxID=116085 RepID=UPI001C021281|nr:zinc ribbon domain-containing protein [Coprococcus catus]MBT9774495.1 zinc-ribbon domain-containing protein [Coprococcus catus]
MAFFDELKKNLSGVTDTVAKTSESVMKKSSTAIEIQKAKLKKVSLEGNMKSLYESLGQLYFEKYADGDMPKEMAELCEKITSCQHAINEAEQRAAFLKGVVICSNCQAEVDKDASYCPKCGAEIIHVVEEDEDDSVDAEDENEESADEASDTAAEEPEAAEDAGESEEESASDAAAEETHKEEGETSDECTE